MPDTTRREAGLSKTKCARLARVNHEIYVRAPPTAPQVQTKPVIAARRPAVAAACLRRACRYQTAYERFRLTLRSRYAPGAGGGVRRRLRLVVRARLCDGESEWRVARCLPALPSPSEKC